MVVLATPGPIPLPGIRKLCWGDSRCRMRFAPRPGVIPCRVWALAGCSCKRPAAMYIKPYKRHICWWLGGGPCDVVCVFAIKFWKCPTTPPCKNINPPGSLNPPPAKEMIGSGRITGQISEFCRVTHHRQPL
jgi:hypothetical protein